MLTVPSFFQDCILLLTFGHWFSLMGTAKFRGFVGKLG
jgi:hypothetical protein